MNAILRLLLLCTALALPATASAATTITVNPGDNVQDKLNSAQDGDTVHFKPGTYTGTFTVAKNITVEGEGGVFLVNPSGATTPTLTFSGGGAKLTDMTILSSVADAVALGQGTSTVQRVELVTLKTGQSALSVAGDTNTRTVTVDSAMLVGPKAFSATYGSATPVGGGITANLRHVTAIGNVVADATNGLLGAAGIGETFADSIIRGQRVAVNGTPTTATITADPARNSVADTAADAAALFVNAGKLNYHLRADAPVIGKGQSTAGESATDIDGQPRTAGAASDYGADQFVNQAPTSVVSAPSVKVRQNVAATFDASKSSDPEAGSGGGIAKYHWDFGDGSTADTTTPTTTHTFTDRKTYSVTVTVTDKQGLAGAPSAAVPVTVVDGTPPTVSISQPRAKQRIDLYSRKHKTRRAPVTFFGHAADDTLLDSVYLALRQVGVKNGRCRWFDGKSKLITGSCTNPPLLAAKITQTTWRYSLPLRAKLPRGPYILAAISVDASGGYSAFKTVTFRFR